MNQDRRVVNAEEAGRIVGLKTPTIRLYTRTKTIPHLKVGRKVLFQVDELEAWLNSHRVPAQAQASAEVA